MYMKVREWNHAENRVSDIPVWGNTPEYPESIQSIVNEILANGYAERGDSTYWDADDEDAEMEEV